MKDSEGDAINIVHGRQRRFIRVDKGGEYELGDTVSIGGDPLLYEVSAITATYAVMLSVTKVQVNQSQKK